MGSAIGQILPFAVGVAISPIPIVALILMLFSASATRNSMGLDSTDEYVTLAVYVLIASVTIIAPVALYLILGERAGRSLSEAKSWLLANNHSVMFVLLLVFGFKLIGDGLAVLA